MKKGVEKEHDLKNSVLLAGNQLLRLRPNDAEVKRRMDQIEREWLQLVTSLPDSEEALHRAQQELLPSRQALAEMLSWLHQISEAVSEQGRKVPSSFMDTRVMLETYKVRH